MFLDSAFGYFAHGSGGEVVMSTSVYLCVCLSVYQDISGVTRAIFTKLLCMLPTAMALSFSGRVMKSQGKGQFWGFSSPLTIHYNAFAAKEIIQSPITSCSRRDHSVAAAFMANGIFLGGGDGSAQSG